MKMRQKTFRSGIAVTASSLGVQFVGFISTIILARLLEPSDFGIMRSAAILLGTMNLFAGMGMGAALIATGEDKIRAAYHAALTTFCGGLVLSVLVFASAPVVAGFFEEDILTPIVRWMSVGVLMISLRIIPKAILEKEMMFGRRIIPDIGAGLTRMIIAVALAFAGFGVWSLVIAWIAERFVAFVVTLLVCPTLAWLKRQPWDRGIARGLWRFGYTQVRTGIVQYAYNNGDGLIVAKVLGTASLGFYTQAQALSNLPVKNISQVVNSVLLPAYAKIRDDKDRLSSAFLSCFQFVAALTIPISMGLFILAPELVIFLIGEKWRDSIVILQVFTLMGFLRPLSGSTSPLFLSLQNPHYNLRTAMIQGVTMFVFIAFFIRWGAVGVAAAVVSAFALGFIYNIYLACWKCELRIRPKDIVARVWPVVAATAIMVAVVHLLKRPLLSVVDGQHNVISLTTLILAGVVTYVVSLILLKRSLLIEILELVSSSLGGRKLLKHRALRPMARFLTRGKKDAGMKKGYPDGFPAGVLEAAVRDRGGGAVVGVRYQHLSGWKKRGAFRLVAEDDRKRDWRFVYKNVVYEENEIAALKGLPLAPGPSEYELYCSAAEKMREFLPDVYASREVVPGTNYWYLLEDLSPEYTTSDDVNKILFLCEKLPDIHAAIGGCMDANLRERVLRFDRQFSLRLLPYAGDNLKRLAREKEVVDLRERLATWEQLADTYGGMLEEIYSANALEPIHGDLNVTNVMFHRNDNSRFKLIDWEWLGLGLPHSELASLLKAVPPQLEAKALSTYRLASGLESDPGFERTYLWCKMQRGIFDAGFFARQIADGQQDTALNLERHLSRALDRARTAWHDLENA
jgi:O-antigen/teichoic acid export membrane protein